MEEDDEDQRTKDKAWAEAEHGYWHPRLFPRPMINPPGLYYTLFALVKSMIKISTASEKLYKCRTQLKHSCCIYDMLHRSLLSVKPNSNVPSLCITYALPSALDI